MISIIVPTKNREASLTRCLSSIIKHTRDYELIIIDSNEYNTKSYSQAMNIGLKKAKGEYLTIPGIANDIEVTAKWADRLIEYLHLRKKIGMAVPRIQRPDGSLECYGGFIKPERYNTDPFDFPDYAGYGIVKREVFEKVGLMDEMFSPIYCEDVDYGLRIKQAGYRIGVVPEAVLIHHHEQNDRATPDPKNKEYLFKKHNL